MITMNIIEAVVLHRPATPELRFLPEGPYSLADGRFSWVAIQHGAAAAEGSLNIFDLTNGTSESRTLPGRPGFAFPCSQQGLFVVGLERSVGLCNWDTQEWTPFITDTDIETDVSNTIINDAVTWDDNLIFGCKELEFTTPKAGLYLYRGSDRTVHRLRNDQICSNGKAVIADKAGALLLYDIDSPTKTIVRRHLNLEDATVSEAETVVDLQAGTVFPDGMILTPDHRSLIVALYDPGDPDAGEAHQYSLDDGSLQTIWRCPGSPRVTCPQLIRRNGTVQLLLTTAVEHMPADQQQRHPNAGCLFIAETSFQETGDQPRFTAPD